MKFKYYLRGIGIGIIFASIIFLVVFHENRTTDLSNEEIRERAKQLGMVDADEPINKLIDKKTDESSKTTTESVTDNSTENIEDDTTEVTTEEKDTTKKSKKDKNKKTTEATTKTTTEAITEATTETATEATTEKVVKDKEVEITVDRGSSSYPVCQKLQELDVIDDAGKFDDYLIENGYANRISVGTHKVKTGMDYKTIAELISDPIDKKKE